MRIRRIRFASSRGGVLFQPEYAMAIPQTSECATNACDDFDYHDQDLTQTYFTKGSLKRANFRGANLSGISLFGANLEEADFTGANLENANLGQCNLLKTNFTGANLTNAIVSGASNLETVKANDSGLVASDHKEGRVDGDLRERGRGVAGEWRSDEDDAGVSVIYTYMCVCVLIGM